ncbi:MAG: TIGR04076 family protein [Candidatus Bathyarchaeia archaeon]
MPISKVKITVLKRLVLNDLDKYKKEPSVACTLFKDGQEFVSERLQMPNGFCSWAWADIQRDVAVLALNGNFDWVKDKGVGISCCTDGFRPVVFKLERIEE